MTTFKHKNGGITKVFTKTNIERLRRDKNYQEVLENTPQEVKETPEKIIEPIKVDEVVDDKPLQ